MSLCPWVQHGHCCLHACRWMSFHAGGQISVAGDPDGFQWQVLQG